MVVGASRAINRPWNLGVAYAIVFDILKDERIKPFVERTMRRLGLLKTRRRKHRHRLNYTEFPRCRGL
jgi:hypothetical protein